MEKKIGTKPKLGSRVLGGGVKAHRERLGMTQRQLEERSGVSQATISRIESGRAKDVRGETLRRLAAALDVTTDYLTSGRDRSREGGLSLSDPYVVQLLALVAGFDGLQREQLLDFGRRYLSRKLRNPDHG